MTFSPRTKESGKRANTHTELEQGPSKHCRYLQPHPEKTITHTHVLTNLHATQHRWQRREWGGKREQSQEDRSRRTRANRLATRPSCVCSCVSAKRRKRWKLIIKIKQNHYGMNIWLTVKLTINKEKLTLTHPCLNVKCLTRKENDVLTTHLHRNETKTNNMVTICWNERRISFSTRFKIYFYTHVNESLNKTKNEYKWE